MKNRGYLIIIIFFLIKVSFAQNTDSSTYKKNALYLEFLGNGGGYSVNYEGVLSKYEGKGYWTLRIGFSYSGEYVFPILINHVSGHQNHHLETGIGLRLSPTYTFPDGGIITANIMYRYQKPNGKFLFRVGWTPIFYSPKDWPNAAFNFWGGVSAGYLF